MPCRNTRNALLLATAIAVLISIPAPIPAQTLRQAAQRIGLLVGTAVAPQHLPEPLYAETLARQYNMLEPENAMKWGATEPALDHFNFGPADELVAFAEKHGMAVRGHNLLWAVYNPAWLSEGQFTPAQLRAIMKKHILTEVGRYRGKVFAWDVVNEAFDARGQLKHSIWYDEPGIGMAGRGTAYIAQAFRWAHQADPRAVLFYNDYAAEGLNAKSDAIYAMVKDFKRHGVPIGGVGLQMHLGLNNVPDNVARNIARLAALGVQVQITEMDVALPADPNGKLANPEDLKRQAEIYARMAGVCAAQPACTAFQTWGFTDKYSWIPAASHGKRGYALPFDAAYKEKPAYHAILQALQETARKHPGIESRRAKLAQER